MAKLFLIVCLLTAGCAVFLADANPLFFTFGKTFATQPVQTVQRVQASTRAPVTQNTNFGFGSLISSWLAFKQAIFASKWQTQQPATTQRPVVTVNSRFEADTTKKTVTTTTEAPAVVIEYTTKDSTTTDSSASTSEETAEEIELTTKGSSTFAIAGRIDTSTEERISTTEKTITAEDVDLETTTPSTTTTFSFGGEESEVVKASVLSTTETAELSTEDIKTTTEGYAYTKPSTTTTEGYTYTRPSTTTTEGYAYTKPSTTTTEGYAYTKPTTTTTVGYAYTKPSTTYTYNYPQPSTKFEVPTTQAATDVDNEIDVNSQDQSLSSGQEALNSGQQAINSGQAVKTSSSAAFLPSTFGGFTPGDVSREVVQTSISTLPSSGSIFTGSQGAVASGSLSLTGSGGSSGLSSSSLSSSSSGSSSGSFKAIEPFRFASVNNRYDGPSTATVQGSIQESVNAGFSGDDKVLEGIDPRVVYYYY